MAEPTPGPYQRDGRAVYALTEARDRQGRTVLVNRFYAAVQGGGGASGEELEAVATLFQAAPELLKAREVALAYSLKLGLPTDVNVQLHAAIDKARGLT